MMLAPLATILVAGPIDGEAAVEIARRFFERMGVRKVGGLVALTEQRARDWGERGNKVWSIGFSEGGQKGAYASIDEKGEVFRAGRTPYNPVPGNQANVKALKAHQGRLMRLVPHALPVRSHRPPESFYADGQFDVLVNGLPFFNVNPSYCYYLSCNAKGELISFARSGATPPTPSPKPKIARDAATARLITLWGKRPHVGAFPEHVRAELGYYLVKGERTARLVWKGWVYQDRTPLFDGASTVHGFVDAATGETVKENPGE